ncbi:hypothetical protein TURU_128530 [Turdus rufiventris]|nr:hypothetical protein TURU_128530 [Turdus rufiventris]
MACPQDSCPPGMADGVREQNGPPGIQEEAVRELLSSLDVHKSMGPDGIHARVMRELADELAKPLSIIYQQSWLTGEVPDDCKLANVTAIHKKGGKEDPGNYRPVILTSVPDKVMEQFISTTAEEIVSTSEISPSSVYFSDIRGLKQNRARLQSLIYDNSYDIYDKELLKVKPGKEAKIIFWIAISIALSWTEELIVVAVQAILK